MDALAGLSSAGTPSLPFENIPFPVSEEKRSEERIFRKSVRYAWTVCKQIHEAWLERKNQWRLLPKRRLGPPPMHATPVETTPGEGINPRHVGMDIVVKSSRYGHPRAIHSFQIEPSNDGRLLMIDHEKLA